MNLISNPSVLFRRMQILDPLISSKPKIKIGYANCDSEDQESFFEYGSHETKIEPKRVSKSYPILRLIG